MKDTLTEMKNNLQGINSRINSRADETENQIRNVEDKTAKNTQSEQQK